MPAGQQLQELGMRLRCDDSGSENVSIMASITILVFFCFPHIFHFILDLFSSMTLSIIYKYLLKEQSNRLSPTILLFSYATSIDVWLTNIDFTT